VCSSSIIGTMVKGRRMRWAGHITRMREMRVRIQGFGRNVCRQDTIWKSKEQMRGSTKMCLKEV
jgi:hypothetical protein